MFTSAFDRFRDEPGKGLATILGVLLIMGLLWAIGHVAQGQVQRAQARDVGQVYSQDQALRCAAPGSGATGPACAPESGAFAVERESEKRPIYASYR